MTWDELADELGTDAALKGLDARGIQAVIDILALVVFADEKLSMLERSEFEDQIDSLPWLAGKDAEPALRRAKEARTEDAWKAIVRSAAGPLRSAGVGEKVYRMAAQLAWSDLDLHRNELRALQLIAEGLGVPADKAAAIDNAIG
ncbi:MAG: TerB family tellurite resistance protein [Myxococcales bacterium]|nr:TerB family tellurite resistance protein [Myxococcales bacterium]MCB9544765.1 TerB family tellurite resistance protein [Myxococcales bacterium]